jgi:hypothetical protein
MLPPDTQESCHGLSERMSSIIHAGDLRDVYLAVTDGLPVIQAQSANSCCKSPIIKHCAGVADSDRLSLIHAPKPCRHGESD